MFPRSAVVALVAAAQLVTTAYAATISVPATDPRILWAGRRTVSGSTVLFDLPAVSVTFVVTGATTVQMQVSELFKNRYIVRIDGAITGAVTTTTVTAATYTVCNAASGLTTAQHTIQIFKDTEVSATSVRLRSACSPRKSRYTSYPISCESTSGPDDGGG